MESATQPKQTDAQDAGEIYLTIMNNRILLFIFLGCLAVYAGLRLLRKDHKGSFDPVISRIDTSSVDRIKFIQHSPESEFEVLKDDNSWFAVEGTKRVEDRERQIQMMLGQLASLRAERIVTREEGRYTEFEITDDKATELIAYSGRKELIHLFIGGFSFDQATRSASGYVRKKGDPAVYEVNGFVTIGLKQRFDQYRDKTIVNVEASDLSKLEWVDSFGQKQVITKEDNLWYYAGMEALDSTSFHQYLLSLSSVKGTQFSEKTTVDGLNFSERLTIYGINMKEPMTVTAYVQQDTTSEYLIHSSANPDAIFLSDSSGIYKRIFADLRQFWP